jgi:mannose-6-phosphate isomerase-like protein (cupin superfamily)
MEQPLRITPGESVAVLRSTPEMLEVEGRWGPGGRPPPKHFHPSQDEHFEVRSGRLRARVDDEERELASGDTLDIPPGAVHQMWNEGVEPATALWQTRPALRTLEWFETIDSLHREGRVAGNGMPGPLAFATLLTEYRDVFRLAVGPDPLVRGVLAALAPLGRLKGYGPRPRVRTDAAPSPD